MDGEKEKEEEETEKQGVWVVGGQQARHQAFVCKFPSSALPVN